MHPGSVVISTSDGPAGTGVLRVGLEKNWHQLGRHLLQVQSLRGFSVHRKAYSSKGRRAASASKGGSGRPGIKVFYLIVSAQRSPSDAQGAPSAPHMFDSNTGVMVSFMCQLSQELFNQILI